MHVVFPLLLTPSPSPSISGSTCNSAALRTLLWLAHAIYLCLSTYFPLSYYHTASPHFAMASLHTHNTLYARHSIPTTTLHRHCALSTCIEIHVDFFLV